MNVLLEKAWSDFLGPMLRRPKRLQVAALCHKGEGRERRYLLITSRETKRWIIPKGWPVRGLKSNESALQEAWEEAGVKGRADSELPTGTYTYQKTENSGWSFPVETLVFSVAVDDLADTFPEVNERSRKWVTAEAAAGMVAETDLQQIFCSLPQK